MALLIEGVIFDELTADPGSPVDGEVWYNTTDNRLKVRNAGVTDEFISKAEFEVHTTDLANPHDTDLEEARSAGNTLSGDIAMGGNKITGLGTPTADADAATKIFVSDQISQRLRGLDWQESILDRDLATPPAMPSTGDRYIVATGGTGAWVGKDGQIAEFDGSVWVFSVPNEGFATRVSMLEEITSSMSARWTVSMFLLMRLDTLTAARMSLMATRWRLHSRPPTTLQARLHLRLMPLTS